MVCPWRERERQEEKRGRGRKIFRKRGRWREMKRKRGREERDNVKEKDSLGLDTRKLCATDVDESVVDSTLNPKP